MQASDEMIRVAILDDYQNVSLKTADWSPLAGRAVAQGSGVLLGINLVA
jgi:hypothetical protein